MIIRDNRTNRKIEISETPDKLTYRPENSKNTVYRIVRKPYEGQWIYTADNPGVKF